MADPAEARAGAPVLALATFGAAAVVAHVPAGVVGQRVRRFAQALGEISAAPRVRRVIPQPVRPFTINNILQHNKKLNNGSKQ